MPRGSPPAGTFSSLSSTPRLTRSSPAGPLRSWGSTVSASVARPSERWPPCPADPRDLLDPAAPVAVDLVFTRDRRAIDYAISQSRWLVVALPYDRSYTLIAPALPDSAPTVADSSLLAAVGPDARLPAPPFWWQRAGCPVPSYPRVAGQATEFLYLGSDPVARDVAARLVALATRTTPPRWLAATLGATGRVPRAIGADPAALHRAIDSASALVIVADPTEGCSPAPWSWGARLRIPLLETRPHLIVRRGLGPVWFDGNGIVRLDSERP